MSSSRGRLQAKELFAYNRDYYAFDQKQRLDREMLRLEMQIKRCDLSPPHIARPTIALRAAVGPGEMRCSVPECGPRNC